MPRCKYTLTPKLSLSLTHTHIHTHTLGTQIHFPALTLTIHACTHDHTHLHWNSLQPRYTLVWQVVCYNGATYMYIITVCINSPEPSPSRANLLTKHCWTGSIKHTLRHNDSMHKQSSHVVRWIGGSNFPLVSQEGPNKCLLQPYPHKILSW